MQELTFRTNQIHLLTVALSVNKKLQTLVNRFFQTAVLTSNFQVSSERPHHRSLEEEVEEDLDFLLENSLLTHDESAGEDDVEEQRQKLVNDLDARFQVLKKAYGWIGCIIEENMKHYSNEMFNSQLLDSQHQRLLEKLNAKEMCTGNGDESPPSPASPRETPVTTKPRSASDAPPPPPPLNRRSRYFTSASFSAIPSLSSFSVSSSSSTSSLIGCRSTPASPISPTPPTSPKAKREPYSFASAVAFAMRTYNTSKKESEQRLETYDMVRRQYCILKTHIEKLQRWMELTRSGPQLGLPVSIEPEDLKPLSSDLKAQQTQLIFNIERLQSLGCTIPSAAIHLSLANI